MLSQASSVSSATTASMSSATQASAKRRTSSRSPSGACSGARCRPCAPCSCSIVERARLRALFHRVFAATEHVCDLGGVEAEHVAQQQRGALPWGERLERGDKRELDRLAGLVARFGSGRRVDDPFEQRVGIRLEPGRVGHPSRRRRSERRLGSGRRSAPSIAQCAQAAIGSDPVQPRAQRRALLKPAGQSTKEGIYLNQVEPFRAVARVGQDMGPRKPDGRDSRRQRGPLGALPGASFRPWSATRYLS
jgi:hypothetical protein